MPERPAFANSPHYRWQVVAMLWFISVFNYADRQAVFSVFPLLETELHLTKPQLGLLGSAFAWTYGICSPFAGLLVDRMRRTTAILTGLYAWSFICVLNGVSRTFPHLFTFRALEGLGETLYFPASMSLISDYHGKDTRSRAMGLHQTSVYMGTIAGGFFAGLIGQQYGWRWSFYIFGGLGILLGFVLQRYLVEPVRGMADEQPVASTAELSFPDFLRHVFTTPTALLLMGAFICNNFVAVVLLSWMPNFLYTKFNLTLAAAGLSATIFAQLASMAGSPLGGWLADTLRKRTPAGRILVQAFAALAAAPFVYLCGTRPEYGLVLSSLFLWGMFKGLYDANIWASLFDVIRPEARGRAVGFMNMVGWIGGGTAPLIIGLMAEKQGLGSAIATSGFVYVLGAALLALAAIAINRIPRASAV